MSYALLFMDALLFLLLIHRNWVEKSYCDVLNAKIDIADVAYAFTIRRIRENTSTYTLFGADEISIRISKEQFEIHEVAVGKIWLYDGENYHCIDPELKLFYDQGVVKHD